MRGRRLLLLVLLDIALLGAGTYELLLNEKPAWSVEFVCGVAATAAIVVRHRFPWIAFALTLPAVAITSVLIPTLITLYTVARRTTRHRWMLVLASLAVVVLWLSPWDYEERLSLIYDAIYAAMFGITPVVLGQLMQTRKELSARVGELLAAQRHEHDAIVAQTRIEERSRLAREMHDVVSHQVSLIAVQAGALQVLTPDAGARDAARTIRAISVRTLDELRQMLTLLRATDDSSTDMSPQPDIEQLAALLAESGIETEARIDDVSDLPLPLQRALYRAVQEGLTNVRKHAPGASASITMARRPRDVELRVRNAPPAAAPEPLPSLHLGHVGLRERAELLGGTFSAGPLDDGGYEMVFDVPL